MEIQNIIPIEWNAQRVLPTAQVANAYSTTTNVIKENFRRAKEYFTEGVHYFKLEGEELRQLKAQFNEVKKFDLLPSPIPKMASCLYLWTYEGCIRHCKMLNTKEAWDMFNQLERVYFGVLESEIEKAQVVQEELPFAQRFSAAARRSVARDFKESKAAPVVPAFVANPELARELIAIAQLMEPAPERNKILIHAANLLIGERLF